MRWLHTWPNAAGSGKSRVVQGITHALRATGKGVLVCTKDNIAASLVRGRTFNSAFRIPPNDHYASFRDWKRRADPAVVAAVAKFWGNFKGVLLVDEGCNVSEPLWRWVSDLLVDATRTFAAFGGALQLRGVGSLLCVECDCGRRAAHFACPGTLA